MSLDRDELKTLAAVWRELNAITARDGAPAGVCPNYWKNLQDKLRGVFESNNPFDGKSIHCHPFLYERET